MASSIPGGNRARPEANDLALLGTATRYLALLGAGNTFGLGRIWTATPLVRRFPWLA